ncbi:MAG TPA: TlpA disulfide reductase family protein [Bacteroidia bacterium]|nr:TlpA disulfide reductase family protein [Bacteroidia bacterium]
MKTILYSALVVLILSSFTSDNARKIPSVDLKTLEGKTVSSSTFSNDGKPIIISFWATWCSPCKKELNAVAEVYDDWRKETGVKLIAVSLDDSRSSSKVAPYVNSKGWEYDEYLDLNSDFKRAMGVNNPPHTFIVDGKGNVVWQHVGYKDGDEAQYIEVVRKIIKGEKIEH